jgi:VanZ family protein
MTISLNSSRLRAWLRWSPALLFAIIIFYFSSLPGDKVEEAYNSLDTITQPVAAAPAITVATPAEIVVTQTALSKMPMASVKPTALPISGVVRKIPMFSTLDFLKVGHGIGYFWLGWAVFYALRSRSRRSPSIAILFCILYAASDEFHQIFVPGRSAAIKDIFIDTLSALAGVALLLTLLKIRASFRQKRARIGEPYH